MSGADKRIPADPETLLGALAANEIADGQLEALHELLVQDTPAARELARRIRDTLLIRGWLRAESDERFSMETVKLIVRLRQDSGRTFVLDTMQRVRDAAQKGRQATNPSGDAKPSRRRSASHRPGRRSAWIFPFVLALASAACVFVAFHLGLFQSSDTSSRAESGQPKSIEPQSSDVEVVVATDVRVRNAQPLAPGDRARAGDTIATGPDGNVTLRYADGTSLELQGGGELVLLSGQAPASAKERSKDLILCGGELSVQATPQRAGQPLVIRTPHATATVVGTRFSIQVNDSQTRLRVTEGTVQLQRGSQSLLVEKDTLAIADASGLRKAGPDEERPYVDLMAKLSVAGTSGDGHWSVRSIGEGPMLCQTDVACDAAWIRLASPKWKAGYLTGQCRILRSTDKAAEEHPAVGCQVLVGSPTRPDEVVAHSIPHMFQDMLMPELLYDSWLEINVRFHVSDDHRLHIQSMQCWNEGMPPPPGRVGATGHKDSDPQAPSIPAIEDVDRFGLAIECHKAQVEFRNLRFCPGADIPELQLENTVLKKIAAQKGFGIDIKNATASENGTWRLAETDEGLQLLREDGGTGPSDLKLAAIPHRRVLLSGQVMALPPDGTGDTPALLADEHTRVPKSKEQFPYRNLQLSRRGSFVDSPCFLAVPAADPSGRSTSVMHFHSHDQQKRWGIPETGKWYHFVVFFNPDWQGKRIQGHFYWPEGQPTDAFWCTPLPQAKSKSDEGPFTLRLYTDGQRILYRNLKIVPY